MRSQVLLRRELNISRAVASSARVLCAAGGVPSLPSDAPAISVPRRHRSGSGIGLGAVLRDRDIALLAPADARRAAEAPPARISPLLWLSLLENPRRLLSAILLADALVNLPLIIICLFLLAGGPAARRAVLGGGTADFHARRLRLRSGAEGRGAHRSLPHRQGRACAVCACSCRSSIRSRGCFSASATAHRRAPHSRAAQEGESSLRGRTRDPGGTEHGGRRAARDRERDDPGDHQARRQDRAGLHDAAGRCLCGARRSRPTRN